MAQQAHHIIPVDVFKKISEANLDINFETLFGLTDGKNFQQMGMNFIYLYQEEKYANQTAELLRENPNIYGDIPVGGAQHDGSHKKYNDFVESRLKEIFDKNLDITPNERKMMVLDLQRGLKEILIDGNPDVLNADNFNEKSFLDALNQKGVLSPFDLNTSSASYKNAQKILEDFDKGKAFKQVFNQGTRSTDEFAEHNAKIMHENIKLLDEATGFLTDKGRETIATSNFTNPTEARAIILAGTYDTEKFISSLKVAPNLNSTKLTDLMGKFKEAVSLSMTRDVDANKLKGALDYLETHRLDAKAVKLLSDLKDGNGKTITLDLNDINFNKLKLESFTGSALWEVLNHIEQDANLKNMVDVQKIRMDLADHISQATGIDKAVRDEAKGFYEFHKQTNAIGEAINKNHSNVTVDKNGLIDSTVVVNGLKEAKPSLETLIQKFAESPQFPKTPKLNAVGKIADFINNVYDGLIEGLSTNKWDKFFAEVKEHGVETIIGVGVSLVVVGLVSFVLGTVGTTALALVGIASVGFAAYDLTTKVINIKDNL